MQIRRMEESDIRRVSEIEKECFSVPWTMESFITPLKNSAYRAFVALIDDKVVGYACTMCIIDEVELLNIAVARDYRRRGVALGLMQHMFEQGKLDKAYHYMLEVRENNSPARALYESLGFEVTGRRTAYYTNPVEDALLMDCYVQE